MPAWQDFGEWNGGVAARRADLTEQEHLWATVARAEADRETMARWPGDCLLGAMAGKPTGRAGMFRRGPENRAGTFMRRSCRASGSVSASPELLALLGALLAGRWEDVQLTEEPLRSRAHGVVSAYATWHLDRSLRSLPFLRTS